MSSSDIAAPFISYSRNRLNKEFPGKIKQCVDQLTEEDIWWRAHDSDNSIGNLLLHLSGNIRQWIISGIGGTADARNRPKEFAERTHIPKAELMALFEGTLAEADQVLAKFDLSNILEVRHVQRYDVTCLEAISHVVEHVAQHMGQIIYITKLRKGVDLKFYDL